jgi:hypothetical protein
MSRSNKAFGLLSQAPHGGCVSQAADDVLAPQPAKSRQSRIALAASVAGAVLAVPVA